MNLAVIEYEGIRVITTEQLAEVYETDINNIKNNFNRNKDKFSEGIHYYYLEGEDLRDFKNEVTDSDLVGKRASSLYLWTERGANRHCKILDTNKAWEQFDTLEETYFKIKESKNFFDGMSKELQAILVMDKKQQQIDNRVRSLENNMTIDYAQQSNLRDIANRVVVQALGGKSAPAYKEVAKKVFSSIWKDYKRTFQVNSYANTLVKDFHEGKEFLETWKPERDLELMILGANAQRTIFRG